MGMLMPQTLRLKGKRRKPKKGNETSNCANNSDLGILRYCTL